MQRHTNKPHADIYSTKINKLIAGTLKLPTYLLPRSPHGAAMISRKGTQQMKKPVPLILLGSFPDQLERQKRGEPENQGLLAKRRENRGGGVMHVVKTNNDQPTVSPDGMWTVFGPVWPTSLLKRRMLANVPRDMTSSFPRRDPYELKSRGVNLSHANHSIQSVI